MNTKLLVLSMLLALGAATVKAEATFTDSVKAAGSQALEFAQANPKAAAALAAASVLGTTAAVKFNKPVRTWVSNHKAITVSFVAGAAAMGGLFYAWVQTQPKTVGEFAQKGLENALAQLPSKEVVGQAFSTATSTIGNGVNALVKGAKNLVK